MSNLKKIIDQYGHWELFSTFYCANLSELGKLHPDCKNLISGYTFLIVTNNRANSVFIRSKSLVILWNRFMDNPNYSKKIERLSDWVETIELEYYSISKTTDLKNFEYIL